MTTPRFVPNSCLSDPKNFGRRPPAAWHYPSQGATEASKWSVGLAGRYLAASAMQHDVAVVIRLTVQGTARFRSLRRFAAETGIGYRHLLNVVNGNAIMRPEDQATLLDALGAAGLPTRETLARGVGTALRQASGVKLGESGSVIIELAKLAATNRDDEEVNLNEQ